VRSGLAGLFFFIAAIALALAVGGWWLQRIAFDSSTSAAVAATVLHEEPELRSQLVSAVASATTDQLGVPTAQLGPRIDQTLQIPAGAALTRGILGDVHARLVGARDEPVEISADDMVEIVRNQVVATVAPAELTIETISWLDTVRRALQLVVPVAALAGAIALVMGIVAHPRRSDALFGIGMFCVLAAVLGGVLGYVVPAFLLPLMNDDPWLAIVPAVAEDQLPLIAITSVGLAVVGGALLLASTGVRRRKTRSWSSPVGMTRYSDQRHWS
jgi:hypothetical protein